MAGATVSRAPVFVREATGLVREFGLWGSFLMAMGNLNLGLNIAQVYYATPGSFPGADVGILLTLALVPMAFWAVGYAMMSSSIPRSGGDYVWAGRGLTSWGGFAFGFFMVVTFIISNAYNSDLFPSFVSAQTFAVQGALTNNASLTSIASWLSQPNGIFIVGTLALVVMGIITMSPKAFRYIVSVLMVVGLLGVAVMAIVIAATSHSQFVNTFNSYYTGNSSYQSILQAASKQGVSTVFSWAATITALPYSVLVYSGFTSNVYIAGETRRASRNIPLAIAIVFLGSWAFMAGLWYLLVNSLSFQFLTSVGYLAFVNPSLYPLPVPPTMNYFAGLAANSQIISGILGLGFMAWGLLIIPVYYMAISRVIFAMSFDRLIPMKFAEVSDRLHSPVFAVLVTMIASVVTLALFSFTNIITITIDISLAWCIQTAFAGLAILVFPLTRRNLFEQAPTWARKKFGSIPAMSIVGMVLLIFMIIISYFAWISSTVMAANLGMLGILLVGIVLYPIVHYVRKREGINLSLVFAEIPPE